MRYDALTGVYNKRHFEECLRVAVHAARANPRRLSLVVFDLDHFKRINDTHGHVAGDVVLCELAKVAREVFSGDVVFGRVGGEEFAALWEGAELATMVELAEKMRQATASHRFSYEGTKLGVTISAGVAERIADTDEPATTLYDRADAKLYEAKEAGRNCVKA
jgi:diguanylate cyclase (GGDEF)-like protein